MSRLSLLLRLSLVLLAALAVAGWLYLQKPIHQDTGYHKFADQRELLGVPHFWNVVSNLPFLLLGMAGLWIVARSPVGPSAAFELASERWPYLVFFAGAAGTAFGSGYYHLDPNNQRLVWDRLPMTVAFTALCASIIAERISVRAGVALVLPLVAAGIASVIYWSETDDLRPYYFVQFFPLAGIPLLLFLFPARYTGSGFYLLTLFWYLLAKVCEMGLDRHIYNQGHWLSGHTLKHLLAAVGIYCILRMVMTRRPMAHPAAVLGESAAQSEPVP